MKDLTNIEAIYNSWFRELNRYKKGVPQIIIGYGSFLSKSSREGFSNIRSLPLPLQVNGWERGWITRSQGEKQTYVGVVKNKDKWLNALAFYSEIDESLLKREQDYRFTEIKIDNLEFLSDLTGAQMEVLSHLNCYICETLNPQNCNYEFRVNSSYIDTCLKGCLELNIKDEVSRFIQSTSNWPSEFKNNDRLEHKYPRAANIMEKEIMLFDSIEKQTNKS